MTSDDLDSPWKAATMTRNKGTFDIASVNLVNGFGAFGALCMGFLSRRVPSGGKSTLG